MIAATHPDATGAGSGAPPLPATGEVAVLGLGKSGVAAAELLRRRGLSVYASDASTGDGARRAAETLRLLDVTVAVGTHDLERIGGAALVVASPGIPPTAPPLVAARERGVEVISEIELALRAVPALRYVAVTGTNGKTTTTALIGHLLRALGHDAVDAGNIGTPLAAVALRDPCPGWVALELSSFQLHDTPSVAPAVGVLTNVTPDHLDRYPTVDAYYADKALLFTNASPTSRWVLNADDPISLTMTASVAGERLYFSTRDETPASAGRAVAPAASYDRAAETLMVLGQPLLRRTEFPLLGDHNVANALAASLAVMAADPAHRTTTARERIAAGLRTFRPPPHRLELVGEWDGVQWINDSKATNISSTLVAVEGMTRPTVLLLGGRHKGEPYTALAAPIRAHVTHVIAYGESAPIVEQDLRGVVPITRLGSDFMAVIDTARELARPGDAVLLSPACSSYDMFDNYEERGARFRELASPSA